MTQGRAAGGAAAVGLGLKAKIGFALGDVYGGGSGVVISMFYLYFLTDVVRLPAGLAGTLLLVSKVWDAAIDPALGLLTDRTRTRWGRRRPYFLFGMPLVLASFFILWCAPAFRSDAAKFAFALGGYLFMTLVSSAVMIPYNSLASELTSSYAERSSLTQVRMIFSVGSSLVCAVVPDLIVRSFPDPRLGYPAMGAAFGLFFALPFAFTFAWTREKPEYAAEAPALDLYRLLVEPWKLGSYRKLLGMFLFGQMTGDVVMAVLVYYCAYYLRREGLTTPLMGVLMVAQLAGVPAFTALARRRSKRSSYMASCLLRLAASAAMWAVARDSPAPWLFALAAVLGLGTSGSIVMVYSMLADLPDADELFSGERREGMYFGLVSFLRQVSSALALFLLSQAIALSGYLPPVEAAANGAAALVKQEQPESFLAAIKAFFVFMPIAAVLLCLWFAARYRLSPEAHRRLVALLEARRAGLPADPAEEAALKELLG
ncbi:MAG TPA: MFS transporter [Spirochaetales bacterium]|nr:MFS transporter [Spirochaetales bacterium]HRY55408.1 MFS transporter [Spirochaetia bacterium]HRZ64234.1 MFS transporter [Spirochaetia bacterium]